MGKKLIGIAVIAIMLFGVFGLAACNLGDDINALRTAGKAEIDAHVATLIQTDYTVGNWQDILQIAADGKAEVNVATTKSVITTVVDEAKEAINKIEKEDEMDFVLTISVDSDTKNRGEDFVVEVSLKNQSGEDISISYYHSPFLANIENWQYPHPPFGMPLEPDILALGNGDTFTETWSLGAIGYLNPVTYESSSLPTGTHDLHFSVRIVVDQNEIIIRSNTIKLIVK